MNNRLPPVSASKSQGKGAEKINKKDVY